MVDIADLRYCGPEESCKNLKGFEDHFKNLPEFPDIKPILEACYGQRCSWLLLMLLMLVPISIALMCYMKWHVLPFIGELGGSSQDVDSTISGLKENPEEIPISEPEDVEASNFDSAPAGSTHARNVGESGALCGDEEHHV